MHLICYILFLYSSREPRAPRPFINVISQLSPSSKIDFHLLYHLFILFLCRKSYKAHNHPWNVIPTFTSSKIDFHLFNHFILFLFLCRESHKAHKYHLWEVIPTFTSSKIDFYFILFLCRESHNHKSDDVEEIWSQIQVRSYSYVS